jgi:P4 family phage/plasmid primase-like protien
MSLKKNAQYIKNQSAMTESTNTQTVRYSDLNDFLNKHKSATNVEYTHTRIGGKKDTTPIIYGGSYTILPPDKTVFYKLYYDSVFVQHHKEYLTEKQIPFSEDGAYGPLVVDFDFRFDKTIQTRQYTETHITDLICEYMEELSMCYHFPIGAVIPVYIYEKPNLNVTPATEELNKDGIHMLMGLQVDHAVQLTIRDNMLKKMPDIMHGFPLKNTWDTVLDEGISRGSTGWTLFGSRKPGFEAYELTRFYTMTNVASITNREIGEFSMTEIPITQFDVKQNLRKMSVQYTDNPKFEFQPSILPKREKYVSLITTGTKKTSKIAKTLLSATASSSSLITMSMSDETGDPMTIEVKDIKDADTLSRAVQWMLSALKPSEYEIRETHEYTQALSDAYYKPGSHNANYLVACALKTLSNRLLLSWIMLRSKAVDFQYSSIPELVNIWTSIPVSGKNGKRITFKSIPYWLKKENMDEFNKINNSTVNYFAEQAIASGGADYDIAKVPHVMYREKFVCSSFDGRGKWYTFLNHGWKQDRGAILRNHLSEGVHRIFANKDEMIDKEMQELEGDETSSRFKYLTGQRKIVHDICNKLKSTVHKDHIMREAAELFFDDNFNKTIDTNPVLLRFNNGVYEFDFQNENGFVGFRDGRPEDYITMSTGIDYVPLSEVDAESRAYLIEFMNKLYPIADLNTYMWEHFASCLIGTCQNQTFSIYNGSGSNGKTIVVTLMSLCLGDYKGTVPVTLVMGERQKIGGTCDEIVKLKSVRYAVMQEVTKGMVLNEGIMKELTGGGEIIARGLYQESITFKIQFTLAMCTNIMPGSNSTDDGTWRRIRKCDHVSKFANKGEAYNDDTPYVFEKDVTLEQRLPKLAPLFMSMLVDVLLRTKGIVKDCETVMSASSKYQNSQNHLALFAEERLVKTGVNSDVISKTQIMFVFKEWFIESFPGMRMTIKGLEMYEFLNKRYGEVKTNGWRGLKIIYPEQDETPN